MSTGLDPAVSVLQRPSPAVGRGALQPPALHAARLQALRYRHLHTRGGMVYVGTLAGADTSVAQGRGVGSHRVVRLLSRAPSEWQSALCVYFSPFLKYNSKKV